MIPYLSHGVGVDQSQYSGQSSPSTPLVIPYLSHGVGVGKSQYGGQGAALSHTMGTAQSLATQPSDVFTRAVERHIAFVNGMNATAAAFSRLLRRGPQRLRAGAQDDRRHVPVNGRAARRPGGYPRDQRDRHRLAVAVDCGAARRPVGPPRDRHDLRRPVHHLDRETNWNTVFMVGGALLGVLLIVAAAVALSRRQHGRVLAH